MLEKIISSFIVISGAKHIFAGIDSTGWKKDDSCFTVFQIATPEYNFTLSHIEFVDSGFPIFESFDNDPFKEALNLD